MKGKSKKKLNKLQSGEELKLKIIYQPDEIRYQELIKLLVRNLREDLEK